MTKINLAVASALLAVASSAQAGISIPAGDWTLDIGGVVNAYYTSTTGIAGGNVSNITTGLLPNYLAVSGKTRQNDLDVGFTISINPGASTTAAGKQSAQQENRQAFLTFGDASWGSIKLGKDLGIYASDAILNDMTLLGVGSAAGSLAGNTTTLGRIGTGFIYADWKSQVAYTSPNWNGFSFTAGVTQSWNALGSNLTSAAGAWTGTGSAYSTNRGGNQPAFEGKASYAWEGDVSGKVWVSAISQKVKGLTIQTGALATSKTAAANTSATANAYDIGANVNVAGFGLTGYYNKGEGMGTTVQFNKGFDKTGAKRDSDDWYIQGTYTIPNVGTKLGVSYGESTLDGNGAADTEFKEFKNSMWTVGAYHPLTKHLNLVAEYSNQKVETTSVKNVTTSVEPKTISLGAILFF